jgi:hypothetical protein
MRDRSGPFWHAMQGRAPLPHAAATLGMVFIDTNADTATTELAFAATEAFTNPSGNVLGAFVAAMLYGTVGLASLAGAGGVTVATATARVIALRDAPTAA